MENVRQAANEPSLQEKTFRGECQAKPINEILTGLLTLREASVKSQRIQYHFTGANASRVTILVPMRNQMLQNSVQHL